MKVRAPFNYDRDAASDAARLSFYVTDEETGELVMGKSMTQQQFKKDTDINEIVRRFGLTGQLPDGIGAPQSGDFTGITDFAEAMRQVRAGEEAFAKLPAATRARFGNDPGQMLAFLHDENNRDEALKLGMIKKPPEKTRDVVQAVDELSAILREPPKS